MILLDMSGVLHRMVHAAVKGANPSEIDGKYVTSEYSSLLLDYFMQELINIQLKHQSEFGAMVLCFDDGSKAYWRKDFYPEYKASRSTIRDKNKVNFKEIYELYNEFTKELEDNTPWRCITVDKAEADDSILVLAREYNTREKVLIYSADKDFIQAQRFNANVFQYSALTKKWLVPEGKHDSMKHWIMEHVMLGDSSDGVPKVVAHTEFSDSFKNHLQSKDVDIVFESVHAFKYGIFKDGKKVDNLDNTQKSDILGSFKVPKLNRAKEKIGLDIYKEIRFGSSGLNKALEKFGSKDAFLDSHPLYREHYERNFKLVMEEGIPEEIWQDTLDVYNNAKLTYNKDAFVEYLRKYLLYDVENALIKVFVCSDTLTIENAGW